MRDIPTPEMRNGVFIDAALASPKDVRRGIGMAYAVARKPKGIVINRTAGTVSGTDAALGAFIHVED